MEDRVRALIIFARKPEIGKVKTRLAATVGNDKALEIYIKLLEHTRLVADSASCDKHVFLTDPPSDQFWEGYKCELQQGETLGERMRLAFDLLFAQGYHKVMIIGSDCPGLTSDIIDQGFDALQANEIVLGPATDGGYYLLGMTKLYPGLFANKIWSTSTVLQDTLTDIAASGASHYILAELADIDEEKDIPGSWL